MKTTENPVAKIRDLKNGQLYPALVGNTHLVLALINGKIYAMGGNCTHYNAPLEKGVISGNRVVCPWHNACFDIATGDMLEPPGLNSLPSYSVQVKGDEVWVTVPEDTPRQRIPTMVQHNPDVDGRTFVILGAGAAGTHAAETLRQVGFQGQILLITAENEGSYDQTMLSKQYLKGATAENALPLRSPDFYQDYDIELHTGNRVTRVETRRKQITFDNECTRTYDTLLLATGGKARRLNLEGSDLNNIFTLHDYADAEHILDAAQQAKKAVILGSSFIGMEVAAALNHQGIDVTVVSPEAVPFEKILGKPVGQLLQQTHEEHGIRFILKRKVVQFEGTDIVEAAVLENGNRLSADLVVMGVGVQPITDYLVDIPINEQDQSVSTDEYLRVRQDVYAAGDIAQFPDWRTGQPIRIEHWRLAAQHGRIAARNMVGQAVPFRGIPFFWTTQFDIKLRYVGYAEAWDDLIIDGDLSQKSFIALYCQDGRVLAATGSQRDTEMAIISELMRLDAMPAAADLRHGSFDWLSQLPVK